MRFGVLGPLAVWTADGREVRVPEVKVRALLADLLVQDGRPVSADRLADDLWGDRQPGNPGNTLQTKVSQLRRALEDAEPGSRELVVFKAPGYVMRVDTDVQRFRDLTTQGRATEDPRKRAELLTDALALWRGPVLADFADETFAAAAIQRLTEEKLAAQEDWAEARLALGEHSSLTSELNGLVEAHPLRERLRGLQMQALYRAGRQSEALESYRRLRAALAGELGLEPGPELAATHQAILTQAMTPPAGSSLPEPLTALVGRETAVNAVRALIGGTRLVTLVGPGGVGKTRLAIEVARQLGDATLVEFTGLDRERSPDSCPAESVAELTALALGVRDDPGEAADLVERIADSVYSKEILLVLDNCEQLVEPIAQLAERLLRGAPKLRILATSQEPLGLAGEVLWSVPPLEVPGTATVRERDVQAFSAVQLFVARASAAAPGFALDDGNAASVAGICRRLDGVPLALELAATRVRVLGVEELLRRLDDRFRLLAGGHRSAPPRQRTLRAMIDWSWELLSAPERIALRRLAVHAEGCGLDAAEALCAGGDVTTENVLDLLTTLVNRSLVVSNPGPRYRLLESVAAYCLERLTEADELPEMRLRHAQYYIELTERADPLLRTGEQRTWLQLLDLETPNIRRALETTAQQGNSGLALRLVNATSWYWFLRGRIGEARRSLKRALAIDAEASDARSNALSWQAGFAVLAGGSIDAEALETAENINDTATRAWAQWFLGSVLSTMGDMPAAVRMVTQALADFESLGHDWGIAAALSDRVSQLIGNGDFASAERNAVISAKMFDALGDRWGQLQTSFELGSLASSTGHYERANTLHRRGLRIAEELQLWPEVSYQLSWLGRVAFLTKDFQQAQAYHERAMRIGAEHGLKPAEMYAETGLALGFRREGRFDVAERHFHNVLDWHRQGRFESGSSLILAELGFIAELTGNLPEAKRLQLAGFAIARSSNDPRALALAFEGLAGARALAGEHVSAARLLGAAARARESVGRPLPDGELGDVNRITAAATRALGTDSFAAEYRRGSAMTPDELVA
ncbi:MAG: BTAD domain-containing putative transcriptional regulator [Kibdelosporangium sp.]